MRTNRQKLGKMGEDMAANYLLDNGYEIIKRNYQAGHNEIDIIATDINDLIFVEVKSLRNPAYGSAEFRISPKKQQSIIKAAIAYLNHHRLPKPKGVRFDAICVNLENYPAGIVHYKGAFWESW